MECLLCRDFWSWPTLMEVNIHVFNLDFKIFWAAGKCSYALTWEIWSRTQRKLVALFLLVSTTRRYAQNLIFFVGVFTSAIMLDQKKSRMEEFPSHQKKKRSPAWLPSQMYCFDKCVDVDRLCERHLKQEIRQLADCTLHCCSLEVLNGVMSTTLVMKILQVRT